MSKFSRYIMFVATGVVAMFVLVITVDVAHTNQITKACTEAGFVKAEHEACFLRLRKGGTVYPENMKYKE